MMTNSPSSLIDILQDRAGEQGDRLAFRFLESGDVTGSCIEWSYGDLHRRARAVAAALQEAGAAGERVLLLYPPDIEFIAGFMGCIFAGAIAVPTYPPDPSRLDRTLPRLRAIARDCQACFILTSTPLLAMAQAILPQAPELSRLRWLASDQPPEGAEAAWKRPAIGGDTLAFLQYTSGSTGSPKGVMVSHANVLHNERLIALGFGHDQSSSGVCWLPLFHDMGLLGNVLHPLYIGMPCTLMSPLAFLSRPLRWLEAISHFRATTSGGPNFAYDLCARKVSERERERLDLRSWDVAFNGAEPVSADTLDRFADAFASCGFRRQAFYPCYGLAEATLFVTGGEKSRPPISDTFDADELARSHVAPVAPGRAESSAAATRRLVSSGHALLDQKVVIVDPETCTPCAPHHVGEIWVASPSVARGYWNLSDESACTFAAFMEGSHEGPFLRTGDLGFIDKGELFVTGRLKDLIIIRGRNHYPQDIEQTVERAHPWIRAGGCACFAIDREGEEHLGVAVEVNLPGGGPDEAASKSAVDEVVAAIRRAVVEAHSASPYAIVLIQPRSLPKTSSGKVQRRACREDYLSGRLAVLGAWVDRGDAPEDSRYEAAEAPLAGGRPEELRARIEDALRCQVARALGLEPERIDPAAPIASYGLDSLRAMQLVNQIRDHFQVEIPLRAVFEMPTIEQLATWIDAASRGSGGDNPPALVRAEGPGPHPLSLAQERLWYLERASTRAALYNMSMSVRIRGPLDVTSLTLSMREIVLRHEVLRAYFHEIDGRPWQSIADVPPFEVSVINLSALPSTELEAELLRLQDEAAQSPFDLASAPQLRAILFRVTDVDHTFLITMHHGVSDGSSMSVFLRELSALYGAFSRGEPSPLAPLPFQYTDFAAWQLRWLTDEVLEPHAAYWLNRLHDAPAPLQIPHDWPRSADRMPCARRHGTRLSIELTRALKHMSQREEVTLFMTMFAAFAALLYRLTGENDIVVGIPLGNRPRAEFELLIGLFLNNLVLRVNVSGESSFHELLQQVRRVTLDAYEHRIMPFDKLLHELRRTRPVEKMPLYRLFFNMIDFPEGKLDLPGLTVDKFSSPGASAKMDVSFYLVDSSEGMMLEMVYDASILAARRVEEMLRQFCGLLTQIVDRPEAKVADYAI